MRQFRAFLLRLFQTLTGRWRDSEAAAELVDHIERHVDEGIRAGLTPAEARRQANIALGGVTQTAERVRERRGLALVDSIRQDIQFSFRLFRRSPGFAIVAVLTLALGLGVTTAVFTIGNWLVFGPIPGVQRPEQVRLLHTGSPSRSGGMNVSRISYPNYHDIATRLTTVDFAAFQFSGIAVSREGQLAREEPVHYVTPSYFGVLGVRAQAGRLLFPSDDNPSSPVLVAVISDRFWTRLFNRDPGAIGQTLKIAGQRVSIVGVTERGFQGPFRTAQVDLWIPGAAYPVLNGIPLYDNRAEGGYYEFLARLHSGATWPQAEAELNAFVPWLIEQYPAENTRLTTAGWAFWNEGLIGEYRRARYLSLLTVTVGVGGLVLLLTCANVAGLLLIRGIGRADETGIRLAIGAGRARVLRQHVTEGVVLWGLGSGCGALVVWFITRTLNGTDLIPLGLRDVRIPFDVRVAGFAALTSLAIGVLFSSMPAWRALRSHSPVLAGSVTSSPRPSRLIAGSVLASVQLAVSLTLLVGALLLARTGRHVTAIDLGIDPTNVTVAVLSPRDARRNDVAAWQYLERMKERVSALPGVHSAALGERAPLIGSGSNLHVDFRSTPETSEPAIDTRFVQVLSPAFFETLGMRFLSGRAFDDLEFARPPNRGALLLVLTESLARALFGTTDVTGLLVYGRRQDPPREVIGVVSDARMDALTGDNDLVAYSPGPFSRTGGSISPSSAALIVRASTPTNLVPALHSVGQEVDPDVPMDVIVTMEQAVGLARISWDLLGWFFTAFSLVGGALAALGAYSVLAFAVAARRRELGIRMALGATPARVRGLVIRKTTPMVLGGLVLGFAGAAGLGGLIRNQLVGVEPHDPTILAIAGVGLVAIGTAAAVLPAWRASRTNVADTLRSL